MKPIRPPAPTPQTDPACPSRSHNTRWAWEQTGCICRDPHLYGRYLDAERRRKRSTGPDVRLADRLVADLLVEGYLFPEADGPTKRLAMIRLHRQGVSVRALAEQFAVSRRTVSRWVANTERMKLTRTGPRPALASH